MISLLMLLADIREFSLSSDWLLVLPRDAPKITGTKTSYHIGDDFIANCTSYRSKPAAKLYWTMADKQVKLTSKLVTN